MARIVLNPAAVHRTARAKGYEVTRHLAHRVLAGARYLAPRGSRRHGSGKTDTRPSLAQSFGIRSSETPRYVTFEVYNSAAHAATVAVGSSAHDIKPRQARVLAFASDRFNFERLRAGRSARALFFARKVRHPGNKRPVRYLQTPLAQLGRKNNFVVTVVGNNRSRLP